MNKVIKIGNKLVSEERPIFIIAEAGVNHNGSLKLAKRLIDAAAHASADAVKFQTFSPETLVTRYAAKAAYQTKNIGNESHFAMLKRLTLPRAWHPPLKRYAEKQGLIFLSTPFSIDDADFLKRLGMAAFKIGSTDSNNLPALRHIATFKRPILYSTGMVNLTEVKEAVRLMRRAGNHQIIVLQCTTNYPTPHQEANLRAMLTLKKATGCLVGFSDHTLGVEASIAATALGARVIEKHLTLKRSLPGPDHKASLEPKEFTAMVRAIRNVEQALGTGEKVPFPSERAIARIAHKSLLAKKDLPKGHRLTVKDIAVKRPGTGIPPKYLSKIIGKTITKSIKEDKQFDWKLLRPSFRPYSHSQEPNAHSYAP